MWYIFNFEYSHVLIKMDCNLFNYKAVNTTVNEQAVYRQHFK